MSRRLVVHIGMHKTGTSSIQRSLFSSRDELLADGIDYFPAHENHSHVAALAVEAPEKLLSTISVMSEQDPARFTADLARDFDGWVSESTAPIMVLSGEGLSRLRPDDVARLRSRLERTDATIEIHVYVRTPYAFAKSAAQQALKTGATRRQIDAATFDNNTFYDTGDGLHATARPNYRRRIEPYLEAFGSERVHIHRFGPEHLRENDAVIDFCHRVLGRDFDSLRLIAHRVNESIGPAAAILLQALNVRRPLVVDERLSMERSGNLVQRLAAAPETERFELMHWDWSRFAKAVEADVEWLASASGIDFGDEMRELPPRVESGDAADFAAVAESLNELALHQHDDAIQTQVFRALYFRSIGRSSDDALRDLSASIGRSRNQRFLDNVAHLLRAEGDRTTAQIAVDRANYLRTLTASTTED